MKNKLLSLLVILPLFISSCYPNAAPTAATPTRLPTQTLLPAPTSQPTALPGGQVIKHTSFVEMQFVISQQPLNQNKAFLDFDTGIIDFQEAAGSDAVLSVGTGSTVFRMIRPINGAKGVYLGEQDFDEGTFRTDECLSDRVEYLKSGGPVNNRVFYCWITSEGLYVKFGIKQVTNLDDNQQVKFGLYYTTSPEEHVFKPLPSPTPQPTAIPEGNVIQHPGFAEMRLVVSFGPLNQDKAFLDFDTETIAFQDEPGSDAVITLGAGTDVFWMIRPINGAKGIYLGEQDFDASTLHPEECLRDQGEYATGGMPFGNHIFFCWITSEGQHVKFGFQPAPKVNDPRRSELVLFYFIFGN